MKYYNEQGELLIEAPDLSLGYLEPREYRHIKAVPAETHKATKVLPGGQKLTYTVVDKPAIPARSEVTAYTYILYADHPTVEERLGAVEGAVAEMAMEVYGDA